MKNLFLKISLSALIVLGAASCKEEKKAEAEKEVATATIAAKEYTVDTATSRILWEGNKPTGSHNGTIDISKGMISATPTSIEAGEFTINMKSISSTDLEGDMKANLDNHLMGTVEGKEGDFFNVNTYPNATFKLTGVEMMENGKAQVSGNLTIKDKTNNVKFPANVKINESSVKITTDTFTIDRTQWGVNYGSKSVFDNLGDKFISDDIELKIELLAKS